MRRTTADNRRRRQFWTKPRPVSLPAQPTAGEENEESPSPSRHGGARGLSFTSVAGASMAPVTTSKAPTVVSFKVTPNHLPDTGGVVTLIAKVKHATTCTFAGDGTLTLHCASGEAQFGSQRRPTG